MVGVLVRSTAILVLLALPLNVHAQAGKPAEPPSFKTIDARLNRSLYDAILAGREIFNNGDPAGCYRLFQGALMGSLPFLDHHPELKTMVDRGLKEAETLRGGPTQKAFALRKVMDDVRVVLTKEAADSPAVAGPPKTLWDRLGGEPGVKAAVHEFIAAAAADPKVNLSRGGKITFTPQRVKELEDLHVALISQLAGGPIKFNGLDMKAAHAGMKISDEEFTALMSVLGATLKRLDAPPKESEELIRLLSAMRKDVVEAKEPATPKPPVPPVASLWERLGGEKPIKTVVHDFLDAAVKDPKVDFTRGGKYKLDPAGMAMLEQSLVEFISQATGGPLKYKGKDMKAAHAGMQITDAQFDALAGHLLGALRNHKVGAREIDELLMIVAGTRKDIVEQ